MDYPTLISLPIEQPDDLPERYNFDDVRYTPGLVEYFLRRYTNPGDTVLDPFAGYGTTLLQARDMYRIPFGVEIDGRKIDYLRDHHQFGSELVHGDIGRLLLMKVFPMIDFVMTSPPYMGQEDQADALSGYKYAGNYDTYLNDLQDIFVSLSQLIHSSSKIVVEISNLKQSGKITTLAWDVGKKLAEVLTFEGEVIINWQGRRKENGIYNYGYDHSYCLVYTKSL